jgi:hypothetical protein
MSRQIWFGDINQPSPAWYNVSWWVPKLVQGKETVSEKAHAYGQWQRLDMAEVWSERDGLPIPIEPRPGMEVLYLDENTGNPLLNKYYFGGRISAVFPSPVPENKHSRVECDGPEEDFNLIIPHMAFYQATIGNDSARVTALLDAAVAQFGLSGTWDTVSQVGGPFITYEAGSHNDYDLKSLGYILADLAADPGQPSDVGYKVTARRWFVSCEWNDPYNPGVGGAAAMLRVLHYYSGLLAAQEPIPLTDRPDGHAYYAYDGFGRAASATAIGTSDTGQVWAALLGTWGIDGSNRAYLAAHVGEDIAVLTGYVADGDVSATFDTIANGQRLAFRISSLPATGYKWEGFVVENNGGTNYLVRRYQAGSYTTLGTILITPANGHRIKVTLAGSTIQVYINSVLKGTYTDSFNQAATLHGIGTNAAVGAKWDDFGVWAVGARYWKLKVGTDRSAMINIVTIAGPGSEPQPVGWQNETGVTGGSDGDLTKTATTNAWDAGATSKQAITEDGGSVTASAEQVWKVQDGYNRPDNLGTLGVAESGQAWAVLGTGAVWGVASNQAGPQGGTGPSYALIDSGVSTAIVQATFAIIAGVGTRLAFRISDANNLWYVEAQLTAYKIYKRVAGVETLMATYSVTPANGDVIKVSLEANVIKFYRNAGGPFATVTDAFNQAATKHGIGTASSLTPRFDDFSVWQTYLDMAFGTGTANTITHYNQIAFGWLISASPRQVQSVELGTLVGSAYSYAEGDRFKVAVRPVVAHDGTVTYEVRYFINDQQKFLSSGHPSPSASVPFYAQGAVYNQGATLSNVTIKLLSYTIVTSAASVAKWGPKPDKDMVKRDDLDTRVKRQALGDAIVGRHGQPRQTVSLDTLQEYTNGRVALINSDKLGWQNVRLVIATMQRKLKATTVLYSLELGEADIEWGDEEPLGLLLQPQLEDRTAPAKPTGLAASAGSRDGANTVSENFSWDPPRDDARWIYLLISLVGGPPGNVYRLPAQTGRGSVGGLEPATAYLVRAKMEDWNRNQSDYTSPALQFTTPAIPLLGPPTSLTETGNVYDWRNNYAVVGFSWVAPSDPNSLGITGYRLVKTQDGVQSTYHVGLALSANLIMTPGVAYTLNVNAIDGYGIDGAAATITGTAAARPATPAEPTLGTITDGIHGPGSYWMLVPVGHAALANNQGGFVAVQPPIGPIRAIPIPPGSPWPTVVPIVVDNVMMGQTYMVSAMVIDQYGQESPYCATVAHPMGKKPTYNLSPGGFDNSDSDDNLTIAGWTPISPAVIGDFSVDATVPPFSGLSSLKVVVPPSGVKEIESPQYYCSPTEVLDALGAAKIASGGVGNMYIQPYQQDGTTAVGARLPVFTGITATTFPDRALDAKITMPALAMRFSLIYSATAGGITTGTVWFAWPDFVRQIQTNQYAAASVGPAAIQLAAIKPGAIDNGGGVPENGSLEIPNLAGTMPAAWDYNNLGVLVYDTTSGWTEGKCFVKLGSTVATHRFQGPLVPWALGKGVGIDLSFRYLLSTLTGLTPTFGVACYDRSRAYISDVVAVKPGGGSLAWVAGTQLLQRGFIDDGAFPANTAYTAPYFKLVVASGVGTFQVDVIRMDEAGGTIFPRVIQGSTNSGTGDTGGSIDFSAGVVNITPASGSNIALNGPSAVSGVLSVAGETTLSNAIRASGISTITGAFTADATIFEYRCNSASAFTATLPAAAGCPGRVYEFKQLNTGKVTIDANASETIDGLLTYPLVEKYQSVIIISNGVGWDIIGQSGLILESDGTRWLGPEITLPWSYYVGAVFDSAATQEVQYAALRADYPFFITRMSFIGYVNGTNNALSNWTLVIRTLPGFVNVQTTPQTTAAWAATTWTRSEVTTINAQPATTDLALEFQVVKTGTPGNLRCTPVIWGRLVYA